MFGAVRGGSCVDRSGISTSWARSARSAPGSLLRGASSSSSHSLVLYDLDGDLREAECGSRGPCPVLRPTRAYTLYQCPLIIWFDQHHLGLFDVTRSQNELYARELEDLDLED
jgi:hypothetical protein